MTALINNDFGPSDKTSQDCNSRIFTVNYDTVKEKINALFDKAEINVSDGDDILTQCPINMNKIIDTIGFRYSEFDMSTDENFKGIRGAIFYEQSAIFINSALTPEMKRFVQGHEVGHSQLHTGNFVDTFLDNTDHLPAERQHLENEANAFSYELLMPEKLFKRMYAALNEDMIQMSKYFKVPLQIAYNRLGFLKI